MIIVVKYFASISDAIGKTSEEIVLQNSKTAGDLWLDVSKNIKYKAEKELVGYQYYGGIKEKECSVLIKRFFETIR